MSEIIHDISEKYDALTPSQKTVATYVNENYRDVAFLTLDELALQIGVSSTTVIRFARALGYKGYSDMQDDIRKSISGKTGLIERYNTALTNETKDHLLIKTFESGIDNIKDTLSHLSFDDLKKCVNAIIEAKHVFVLGMRSSFSLSYLMAARLGQVRKNVHLIQGIGEIYPEESNGIGEGDLCIAFMFPRYAKRTVSLISHFKKQSAKIVIITSPDYSMINSYGDLFLTCSVGNSSFKNSYVSVVCLINYLIDAVALEDPKAKDTLSRLEKLLDDGYYLGL